MSMFILGEFFEMCEKTLFSIISQNTQEMTFYVIGMQFSALNMLFGSYMR
jgi:hypothetical protein